jgi:Tol biopolymer transport system component
VQAAVYLMDAHGSNVRELTPPALQALEPDWAPDGSRVIFDTNCCNPRHSAIWSISPDGTGLTQLTFPGAKHDFTPEYSPAGDMIAFERDSADFSTSSIFTMNSDGSGLTEIQADAFVPAWGSAA